MNTRNWGVGTKITVFTFALISVILAVLLTLINLSTSSMPVSYTHLTLPTKRIV